MSGPRPPSQDVPGFERAAVEQLAGELGTTIDAFYRSRPTSRQNVFCALNALAAITASVLRGTGAVRDDARRWFDQALDVQLSEEEADHG